MTHDFFSQQMGRLSGLRFRPADLETHWEALNDIPDDVLDAAVTRAQRTRSEFPSPLELRQDADQVAHYARPTRPMEDRSTPLDEPYVIPVVGHPLRVTAEWHYDCEVCSDGGMRSFWCGSEAGRVKRWPWMPAARCERRKVHGDHEWATACACVDTNRTIQRRRANQQTYAVKAGGKNAA